jgi:hypothetical protein
MQKKINCFLMAFLVLCTTALYAQKIPTPKEHFGFAIGDDYQLATYSQTEAYFKKLAASSDRVKLVEIGKTEEGRSQYMLIVTSPENHKNLDRYQKISQQLAHAEGLTEEQAKKLAAEGKAVVWIDGGLHATETVGAHQLIETAYTLASRTDAETNAILDNVIVLLTHANPDGQELVSNWYMRESDPKKRSISQLPRLYQKYVGHDNNRDFYMMNMKETQNMGRQLFVDWIPQIMYNHHQTGPAGSVVAGAPYRDPFNYVFDPLVMTSIDALGAAMVNRLNAEGKPGYTQRNGAVFSTWYNGGLRTTTYFHNMIGLLTEIIGSPTPSEVPLVTSRLLPDGNTPNPVTPRTWHFRQSIDYSISLNYAVLGYARRYRDELLFNIYQMGKNSIDRGSRDHWSLSPSKIAAIEAAAQKDSKTESGNRSAGGGRGASPSVKHYDSVMKNPELRDPRGYIIPAGQTDFATAVRFVNALIYTGIQVHKSSESFSVNGKQYPAGSYIIKTAQAFRPHILDMFEPQDHPNDFRYPGGPPVPPYDAAGWTLAYQMGIDFDRLLEDFNGPFQTVPYGELQQAPGTMAGSGSAGYVLHAGNNFSFLAINDLLKKGVEVYRAPAGIPGTTFANSAGSFFVPAKGNAKSILENSVKEFGVQVTAISKRPAGLQKVTPARIAIWDTYGGSMPSGWIRWMMEQYHFDADIIFAPDIDAGNLRSKYDVIVFVGGAIPGVGQQGGRGASATPPANIPEEYRKQYGRITAEESIPELKKFLDAGGNIVAIGSSTNLAYHLNLPVRNSLFELRNGQEQRLPNDKYYIPGSVLRASFDSTDAAAWGMRSEADIYFSNSPVFQLAPDAIARNEVKPITWFSTSTPLRSGWAWGQEYLLNGVTSFWAKVGKGKLYAFGPEITFRAQPHGSFRLLFNQLYK